MGKLGMVKLGVGIGLNSVLVLLWRYPAGPALSWMFSGPTGIVLSFCTGAFRWDDGKTNVPPSSVGCEKSGIMVFKFVETGCKTCQLKVLSRLSLFVLQCVCELADGVCFGFF